MEPIKKYTQAIGDDICERIMAGENMFTICSDPHMPSKGTLVSWLYRNTEDEELLMFRKMYDEAKRVRVESLGEEAMYIIDKCANIKDNVMKASKQADVRIKLMEKQNPEKYGKLIGANEGETAQGPVATVKFEIMQQDYGKENEGIETEGVEIVSATITEQEEDSVA